MISFNLQNAVGASFATVPRLRWDQLGQAGVQQLRSARWGQPRIHRCETPQSFFSSEWHSPGAGLWGWMDVGPGSRLWQDAFRLCAFIYMLLENVACLIKKDKQTAVLNEGGQGKTVFLFGQKFICKNKWVQFVIIIYTCLCLPLHLT